MSVRISTTTRRAAVWLSIGTALLAVFMAYLKPDLVMTLASRVWACF